MLIKIDAAILHILDPRGPQQLVKSKQPLPPGTNPEVFTYLAAHIERSLADQDAQPARFRDLSSTVSAACVAGLRPANLVAASSKLADALFALMQADRRITPGDLAVCLFQGAAETTLGSRLALLKLDPGSAFRHRLKPDTAGSYVTLERQTGVLPTNEQRLHKCAFIRPLKPRPNDYDLLLLDRQIGAGQVALYFNDKFLEADLYFTPESGTARLFDLLVDVEKELRKQLSEDQSADLRGAIDVARQSRRVNVDDLIESLGVPDAARDVVRRRLARSHLPARNITVVRAVAQTSFKPRRYQGDSGLLVVVPAEFNPNRFRVVRNGLTHIEIETETWDEIGVARTRQAGREAQPPEH